MRSAAQVLVFPAWKDNPFLNMLELNARTKGYRFLGATTYSSMLGQLTRLQRGDVLHVHWTSPLLQQVAARAEAAQRLHAVLDALRTARGRGVRLVWTLHNRLPHELAHPQQEADLYRGMAELADVVHVMAPDTAEVVSDVAVLDPATTRIIPHPTYQGIYDTGADRAAARGSFGLGERDRSVLFFGQIRPYKGVDALIDGTERARRAGADDLVLMLAGAVREQTASELADALPEGLRTVTHFGFVPDGDLARWFRAADIAVFPYRAILNSGSVHLAATFGVPVILPDEPHLRRQFGAEPWTAFFDTARPAASIAELLGDRDLFAGLRREDFERFRADISPWRIARRYRMLLDELTASPAVPPSR